ncbi:MAG: DUF3048 domain-containing protein, partial [bacterium]
MDDIKKTTNKAKNETFKIKVSHFTDKENEGLVKPIVNKSVSENSNKDDINLDFLTPEQANDKDLLDKNNDNSEEDAVAEKNSPIDWFKNLSKKRKAIFLALIIILLLVIGGGIYLALNPNKKLPVVSIKKSTPDVVKPKLVPSTLTGLPVDPSVNNRTVTAIMIENSIDARPQSGLDQAGVVFEAIAEGGVTRFMGVFQDTQPSYIGPVRSARPYYIQWALGFNAAYAHVGGSPDALADLNAWNVRNIDQFANSAAFQRISSRYAPHNVYTSIAQLNTVENTKGWTSSNFKGFIRKADTPAKTPTASNLSFTLSGPIYNPSFTYNPSTNNYTRSENGAVHNVISQSGVLTPITPKVVVALITPLGQGALDSSGAYYSDYNVLGAGQAMIFQDGTEITANWNKQNSTDQITFTDNSGNPIKLNAGQTWLTAVATSANVSYK